MLQKVIEDEKFFMNQGADNIALFNISTKNMATYIRHTRVPLTLSELLY